MINNPNLWGLAAKEMEKAGKGGLDLDDFYPDEAPADEVELAKIPTAVEHTDAAPNQDSGEQTRSRGRKKKPRA